MKYFLKAEEQMIECSIKRSTRARRVRLVIHPGGDLIVTVPTRLALERVEALLHQYVDWILRQREKMKKRKICELPGVHDREAYVSHRDRAHEYISRCIASLAERVDIPSHTIRIKNHRTRWGSCSRRGMLNFNYRIALLPYSLMEYIIVHEVCHLYEMNHSIRFWNRVSRLIPDYLERRKQLQGYVWNKER